jgi:hypothetical protein
MSKCPFLYLAEFFQIWLSGARLREIAALLVLMEEELKRRGITLAWTTEPKLRGIRRTSDGSFR